MDNFPASRGPFPWYSADGRERCLSHPPNTREKKAFASREMDNNKQLLDEVEHDIMNIYYYSKSQVKEECCDTRQINLDR